MKEKPAQRAPSQQFSKKLIMVLEQDEQVGTCFVQLIRQESPCRAILARTLLEVRSILAQVKCDLMLLTDDTFPDEDLERLYLLPVGIEPPDLVSLTFLSWTSNYRDMRDVKSIAKAVKLLISIRELSAGVPFPPECHEGRIWATECG